MCGRVAQAKNPTEYGLMLKAVFPRGVPNAPAHYNGAPGQDYLIAQLQAESDDITLDMIQWGLLSQHPSEYLASLSKNLSKCEELAQTLLHHPQRATVDVQGLDQGTLFGD